MTKFAQLNTMFKTRIISMSILLLLLVGVTVNVRAGVDSEALEQKTTDQGQSDKESEQEPLETISQLDFFGAFSLLNIQLHWRDLHIGLNDDIKDAESALNQTELSLEEVETLFIEDNEQIAPPSPIITTAISVVPLSTYRTIGGTTDFICSQNTQRASTIAFILNCGTYPKSC
jgi:hypothetical protein